MDLYDAFYNLAKINKIELSQKASMTSKSTLKYFEEKCGKFNKIEDQDEIIEARKKDKVPYIDIISRDSIYQDNVIYINDRCYDKISMKEWALSFKDKTVKPKTPDTGLELTLEDIKSLCLDPSIFTYTYAIEDNSDLNTQMIMAIGTNNFKKVKYLVEQNGMDVNEAYNDNLDTYLMMASYSGHLEIVKYLIKQGADINAKTLEKIAVLANASIAGHLETVKYLVEHGADINNRDIHNKSALIYAIQSNHLETVKYLVEHGADLNLVNKQESLKDLLKALKIKNTSKWKNMVDYLIKVFDKKSEDDFENPVLPE